MAETAERAGGEVKGNKQSECCCRPSGHLLNLEREVSLKTDGNWESLDHTESSLLWYWSK